MGKNTKELELQIAEKNNVLNSLDQNEKSSREKANHVKNELDRLLYMYYKSLKCKNRIVGLL